MKNSKQLPVKAEAVTPEVMAPLGKIDAPDYTQPSERIKFHIGMSQHHGRIALAHLIVAGWELANQKQSLGYGGWAAWCEKELTISKDTADRYIQFFAKTIGNTRATSGIPLAKRLTNKDLERATIGMEEKSARAAMIDIGIIKPTAGRGGKREGAGRKPKAENEKTLAEQFDAVSHCEPLLWASAKGALDTLVKLDAEKDIFHRLSEEHLGEMSQILSDLSFKAGSQFTNRLQQIGTTPVPASL